MRYSQVGYDGALVRRVDRILRVSWLLVERMMPLRCDRASGGNRDNRLRHRLMIRVDTAIADNICERGVNSNSNLAKSELSHRWM
jgi:hypothetical protein